MDRVQGLTKGLKVVWQLGSHKMTRRIAQIRLNFLALTPLQLHILTPSPHFQVVLLYFT
jgi:hypothetical protein